MPRLFDDLLIATLFPPVGNLPRGRAPGSLLFQQIQQAHVKIEVTGFDKIFRMPEQTHDSAGLNNPGDDFLAETEGRVWRKIQVVAAEEGSIVENQGNLKNLEPLLLRHGPEPVRIGSSRAEKDGSI